jgi:hypothetical protein
MRLRLCSFGGVVKATAQTSQTPIELGGGGGYRMSPPATPRGSPPTLRRSIAGGCEADGDVDDEEAAKVAAFAEKARRLSRSRLGKAGRRSSVMHKAVADVKAATDENGVVRL